MSDEKTLGEIAYEAAGDALNDVLWAELGAVPRAPWEQSASAVSRAVLERLRDAGDADLAITSGLRFRASMEEAPREKLLSDLRELLTRYDTARAALALARAEMERERAARDVLRRRVAGLVGALDDIRVCDWTGPRIRAHADGTLTADEEMAALTPKTEEPR
jgi:hypothetical protein